MNDYEVVKHGRKLVENIRHQEITKEEFDKLVVQLREDCPTQSSKVMHSMLCHAVIEKYLKDNGVHVKSEDVKYTPSETPFSF